ncbi:MAG: hypothetical protein GOVbin212_50 [Prokaryotic dsDNA virus sp.]|nr:MAG: hypothetical protein GOVbin212_50 [Prokaryotic dsDNA virus sp.]|tara:strand:- start:22803 stop:23009 length:207 start_codon:yes stop_codon:yes gene_type:complete
MKNNEKDMLIRILKTLQSCDNRLRELEAQFYHEPTLDNVDELVTPITEEVFDAIVKATGSRLIFMGIA